MGAPPLDEQPREVLRALGQRGVERQHRVHVLQQRRHHRRLSQHGQQPHQLQRVQLQRLVARSPLLALLQSLRLGTKIMLANRLIIINWLTLTTLEISIVQTPKLYVAKEYRLRGKSAIFLDLDYFVGQVVLKVQIGLVWHIHSIQGQSRKL